MLLYYLSCFILLLPSIFCNNFTNTKMTTSSKLIESSKEKQQAVPVETKVVLSDGGLILSDNLGLPLLQADQKKPADSTDLVKNKVHARKGVIYSENATQTQEKSSSSSESTINKTNTSKDLPNPSTDDHIKSKPKENSVLITKITSNDSTIGSNTTSPKKPLILVANELENMTVKTQGTSINYQRQSPTKTYVTSTTDPGMVMPIVITILLVPMFAVLGLMAVRRGQEAWKNRHYKRMDFLLDGMYND